MRILPEQLGVSDRSCTKRLQRILSDFGFDRSFARAAQALKEHYGFTLPLGRISRVTYEHAASISEHLDKRQSPLSLPAQGVDTLIAQADGSFIPMVSHTGKHLDKRKNRSVDYQEARLCACRAQGKEQAFYEATFEDVDKVGQLWAQCAKTAGRGLNTQVHCLGDGASWIVKQARTHLSPKRYLVDFYHLCEYLSKAQPHCQPNSRWSTTQRNRLKTNAPEKILKTLQPHLEPEHVQEDKAPVRAAHRYIDNRLDQLDYKGALQEQLPIGSGLIESGHKHILQARLKIPGAAWSPKNAQNIAKARTLRANGKWQQYWNN